MSKILIKRNDEISLEEIYKLDPRLVILSPGPANPKKAGICLDLIKNFATRLKIFGVCLGHQAIYEAFGGDVKCSGEPFHGRSSFIKHNNNGIYTNLPNPLEVGRYHSLIADSQNIPECMEITSSLENGTIMGIKHKKYPIEGVQFHPESILTPNGKQLMKNVINCYYHL